MTCAQVVPSLGSYVLGALDADERLAVEAHLAGCRRCRDELGRLAPLPGLLSRLSLEEVLEGPPEADEAMLDRLLRAATRERRTARHRWLAAAAAVVVLAGGTVAGVGAYRASTGPHWHTVTAATGPVHLTVQLARASVGTALAVQLSGVPPEERCRLVAVSDTGQREVAGSWEATYSGTATIRGTTAIPYSQLARVVVETYAGQQLVSAPA